ncbi:MAG: universal stress protein [Polyangiaceae bacterium]|nr:universal stress protein [Polyangiaceae bacterium]
MKHAAPYRIVVGFDDSRHSILALQGALALYAQKSWAILEVVSVVHDYALSTTLRQEALVAMAPTPTGHAEAELRSRVEEEVQSWREKVKLDPELPIHWTLHLGSEMPAEELVRIADDLDADLLVLGSHGRRGVKRLLLGSTAEKVVRLAHCPVLVMKDSEGLPAVPEIEPPCPECLEVRKETNGVTYWCARHRERHALPHVYHYRSREMGGRNQPLIFA